jgi:two-component system OmpR family sensor kinase/two-component system sensor histidine kinase BaeS
MRRHFVRRVGLFLLLFFGLMFVVNALAWALISGMFDGERDGGFGPAVVILSFGLLLVFFAIGRAVRRMAAPVGDVMEAADRVAAGDYSTRLQERGPREMRRLARSFNAMAQRLQASEEQRHNLLADVTHELRTPLSVIQGNLEGLLDGIYPPDRAHVEPVLEETRVMSRLLEDLQTLSTAEAGVLRLHRESLDPAELVGDAVAAFRSAAAAGGIALEGRVPPGLPSVEADPVRIGQVLANLLHNAMHHTPAGGSVVVAAHRAENGGVAFTVTDTGAGIPPEDLPHVFDRFVKASDSGGAGLGLAIAKSLVEAHGGAITAESEPGRGATMRFVLPATG